MASSHVQRFLQGLAVRTQFPPFTFLYRAFYRAGIRTCTRRIRRIPGVRAIYLRRGLASGVPVYGLSDIDLLVMIDEPPQGRIAAQVRYKYDFLRRTVPMLPPVEELEIYDPETFRRVYERSPFYRCRFDRGRDEWERLYGEDVFDMLPAPHPPDLVSATEDMMPAWRALTRELCPADDRSACVRRYTAYKSVADAARAALVVEGESPSLMRHDALRLAADRYGGHRDALEAARTMRASLASKAPIPIDLLLHGFLGLARRVGDARATAGEPALGPGWILPATRPKDLAIALAGRSIEEIRAACEEVTGIDHAVLVPRLDLHRDAELDLDPNLRIGATSDALDLVLVGADLPTAEDLRRLNTALAPFQPDVAPWFSDGRVALALAPLSGDSVRHAADHPEFFASLQSSTPLDGVLRLAGASEAAAGVGRSTDFEKRARYLLGLFSARQPFRLPVRSFFALFWEAGRAAALADQGRDGAVVVPLSSADVVARLVRMTPGVESELRRVHVEYVCEALGQPSDAGRHTQWAAAYAARLGELLPDHRCGDLRVDVPPITHLTVSVMIVTRNRARFLDQALKSLAEQERGPEEIVVVDNASTDNTVDVVRSFQRRLHVKLIREENVGIPHARNRALAHCGGDVVAVMDDDCVAHPRWLAELEAPFLRDPFIGAVGGSLVPLGGGGSLIRRFYDDRMRAAAESARARAGSRTVAAASPGTGSSAGNGRGRGGGG